jgi:hypothetical protein
MVLANPSHEYTHTRTHRLVTPLPHHHNKPCLLGLVAAAWLSWCQRQGRQQRKWCRAAVLRQLQ